MARVPPGTLMQRAAYGLATAVADLLRDDDGAGVYGARVLLLVGSGDNGGDALYAGALLARRGARVEALLLSERAHEEGLAELLTGLGHHVYRRVRTRRQINSPMARFNGGAHISLHP